MTDQDLPLGEELLRRAELDQDIRNRVIDHERDRGPLPEEHPLQTEWRQIDEDNNRWFKTVIDTHGWPLVSQVGDEAATAAWLFAQHSPDREFMARCLGLMRDAVAHDEAQGKYLAYLEDRVNLSNGRPQRYGTQWRNVGNGLELGELEDPERVDEWRATVGLPSVEEHGRPPG